MGAGILLLAAAAPVLAVPNAPVLTGPTGYTTDTTPDITIASGGGVGASGSFEVSVDGGTAQTTGAGIFTLPSLGQGSHTVEVLETGLVPEPNGPAASLTFSVDSVPPVFSRVVSPASPSASGWYVTHPSVNYTCTDAGSGVPAVNCPADIPSVPDGIVSLAIGPVMDLAGNLSTTLGALTLKVDTVAPAAPVGATPDGYTNVLNPVFTWSVVEDLSGSTFGSYQLQINTTESAAGAINVLGIPQGSGAQVTHPLAQNLVNNTVYHWRVRAVDQAGNAGAYSPWLQVTVDTTAPNAPGIVAGPTNGAATNDNTPTFTVAGLAGSTFSWQTLNSAGDPVNLAGASGAGAVGPEITLPTLPDGTYTFKVNQKALNGTTSDFASTQFTVDTTAPGIPTITGRPGTSANAQPAFAWAPAEQGGSFTWEVYGVGGAIAQGPASTTDTSVQLPAPLKPGSYTFRVRQIDRATNGGGWSLPEPFTITAPTAITKPPAKTTAFRPATRNAHRLFPKVGRAINRKKVILRWKRTRGATLYNVQVFLVRGNRYIKVHSVFPRGTKIRVPWKKMKPNKRYVWRVWPYMGQKQRYSRAPLGISWFRIKPLPKKKVVKKTTAKTTSTATAG